MTVSVVFFLCLVVISLSKSAPVNDALSSGSEFKRGWHVGWSSGKKKDATFGIPPGNSWEITRDHAENDAPRRSEFKRGWDVGGDIHENIGSNNSVNKGGDGDKDKVQKWLDLAKDVIRLFHDQSDDKAAQVFPGKGTPEPEFWGPLPKNRFWFPNFWKDTTTDA